MRQKYQISEQFPSREEEAVLNFPVFLFKEYVDLFNAKSIFPLLIRDSANQIVGFWIFEEKPDSWFTPVSAPFSCPQFFSELEFNGFLDLSESFLRRKSKKPIRFVINPLFTRQNKVRFSKIIKIELNHYLEINESSFMEKLPQKRRRQKLRSLKENDYAVEEVSLEQWKSVYQQNLKWRSNKGHKNFIQLNLMMQFKNTFPKQYLGFQLSSSGKLIACAFVVRVSQEYIYLYSLITDPEYDKKEPSLLLYEIIYDYAKNNSIRILDLGTSMDENGGIHKNISLYKQGIGASAVRKYTFEY